MSEDQRGPVTAGGGDREKGPGQTLESGFDLAGDGWRANSFPVQDELTAVEGGVIDAALAAGDPERELEGAAAQGDADTFAGDLADWLCATWLSSALRVGVHVAVVVGHGPVSLLALFSPASGGQWCC